MVTAEKTREARDKYTTALGMLKELGVNVQFADTDSVCIKEGYEFSVHDGWIHLKVGSEDYGFIDPHTSPSYFTFKPEISQYTICVNYPKMCQKCHEPECNWRGRLELMSDEEEGIVSELRKWLDSNVAKEYQAEILEKTLTGIKSEIKLR